MTSKEREEIHKQHVSLDLYYQAKRVIFELDNTLENLTDKRKTLAISLSRFKDIYNLTNDIKPDYRDNLLKNDKTLSTKKQIKAYKKYLKTLNEI